MEKLGQLHTPVFLRVEEGCTSFNPACLALSLSADLQNIYCWLHKKALLAMDTITNIVQDLHEYWATHFSRRFLPRRPPLRQITSLSSFYLLDHKTRQMELGLDYGLPQAQLSNAKFVFQDGKWQSEGSPTHQLPFRQLFPSSGQEQSNKVLKKENKALLEENNYLKLQLELLMDMLTDTTAQLHTVEKKLDAPAWQAKMKKPDKVLMLKY
ncbi:PREDICTED: protein chibby homolog 3 [Crocodylus porosus]|uniref:protein chibby homolog 3 n=1 Tax=Crocodylus porosus TaxID=8502 RepID=UPI00093CB519|nr:PREDICTED: protein chibby homolog 3 [Crocodylus porosus]